MLPSLGEIFRGSFADAFRRRAQLRKTGMLRARLKEPRRATMFFEPLEQRLLLSADLNPVIDNFLGTLDPNAGQPAEIVYNYSEGDGVITIGNSVGGNGSDIALEDVTLRFSNLVHDGTRWNGQVGVEAISATLFPDFLGVAVTDRDDDADDFAAVGVIDLALGTEATLQLDDIDTETIGWPAFLDVAITELEFDFENFRVNNDRNSLHLEVQLAGLDTGNDTLNELLAADNPLFGLSIEGAAAVTLAIADIEDTVDAVNNLDIGGALRSALAAAMATSLDGVAGKISGKLFGLGSLEGGFIYQKVTVDPDGPDPEPEVTATYLAIEAGFTIGSDNWGDRIGQLHMAFAVSDLGPLQFYISGGPIVRFEPTTGLTLEEVNLGVRFNTTIEELQTETDFHATAATVQVLGTASRVTLTVPEHDLAIGDRFRIREAGNDDYDGEFEVFAVNGDEVIYDVVADPGLFVGDAEILRLTITDPLDLRDEGLDSGIAPPESILVWREQLNAAVTNQIEAGEDIWARLFGEVVFGGGATLSIHPIPDTIMQLEVDLMIDTDLRILLAGDLQFLDGLVSFPASLYADLSALNRGDGRFLFLADVPEVPVVDPLLVLRGEAFFETFGAIDLLDALVTENGSFWDIELELALDNPSEEFIVGDNAVIFGADVALFDGTFEVIAIDDDANSITVRSDRDPGTWGAVGQVANENVLLGGFRMGLAGGVDLNIPFTTTLTLEGETTLEFRIPALEAAEDLRLDFEFDVTLSETYVGNIGNANGAFHLTIDADAPLPNAANPFGGLEIWGAALLTTDFEFLEEVGLFASAAGLLRINSSASNKPDEILRDVHGNIVRVALPAQSFALRLDGSVDFRIDFNGNGSFASSESVFLVEGAFVLEFSAEQGFNVAVFREGAGGTLQAATLQLGPAGSRLLTFNVLGFLAIREDGFAANMALTTDASLPLGLASISASAVLIINTTGDVVQFDIPGGAVDPNRSGLTVVIPKAAPTNPSGVLASLTLENLLNGSAWTVSPGAAGAPYGVVFLKGDLELLSVLDLEVSGYILLSEDVVSMEVNFAAAGNFLNLASASASGSLFFSSEGEFAVDVHGTVQLGPDWINIHGGADLDITYLDNNGRASGGNGNRVLNVTGLLSVGATVFGIDVGDLSLGVSYNGNSGAITVRVPYLEPFWDSDCWSTFLGDICVYYPNVRTAHFGISVGTLTANAEPPPPPVLGQVNNGVLTLNVGTAAGARNLLVEEEDEIVVIDQVGSSIRVSMFGHTQTFSGVTSILIADMASGHDFVDVRSGVAAPLDVRFGTGNDRLSYAGSGAVRAFGEGGNDRLESGGGADNLFGGGGDDLINGGAGNDHIEGGDDSDTLIGGDDSDTILGGLHADIIAGDQAVVEGSISSSIVRTVASAGAGSDILSGGDAFDIIFGGGGSDTLSGDRGNDRLFGDDGMVTLVNDVNAQPLVTLLDLGFSGADRVTWAVGDGNDIVDGQLGNDTLDILGTDGSEQFTLGASGAGFSAAIGAETLAVANVETANVEARRGIDTLTVNDLGASGLLEVDLNLGADSVSDTVIINGSSGADVFTLAPTANGLQVQKQGGATIDVSDAGPTSGGDGVTLNAGDGADQVNVQGTRAGTSTTVNGGAGGDTINVGSLNLLAATLSMDGGEGADVLNVDDTGDLGPNDGTLTSTTISGLGMAASIVYGTIEALYIELGSGADTFVIGSTHAGTTRLRANFGDDAVDVHTISGDTAVDGGADDDVINVGNGTLNGLAAALAVEGGEGADTLNADDAGDAEANSGVLTAVTLAGLGTAGIDYLGIETLYVALGSGADTFTIESTHAGTTHLDANVGDDAVNVRAISGDTMVEGGADDDTVNVGSLAPEAGGTLEGIAALLTIEGSEPASGSDVLNIDDSGDTAANSGALTGTTITGLGMTGAIAYGTIETLNIGLGSGGDTFSIESTHAGETNLHANGGADTVDVLTISGDTAVDGGADDDTVNVGAGTLNALAAPLSVSGGQGADMLNVDDTGDAEPNTGTLTANTITGLGMSDGIGYVDFETLVVSLGSGGNHFGVTGTAAMTVLNTGAGDDVVTVSLDAATDSPLTLNLQAGNDILDASGSSLGLTISGGDGDDVISGGAGADSIHGDAGDDELRGHLGSDALHGGDGDDVLIGDVGRKIGRDVLLLDVAAVAGEISLGAAPDAAIVQSLLASDLVLLAGRTSGEAVALLLTLSPDGDDIITGGEGDDALFGQRGNDTLSGDAGNDLVAGGAGDDRAYGGEGDDHLIGDDLIVDSAAAMLPNVAQGLLVDGEAVVPMLQIQPGDTPNAAATVLPHLFGSGLIPADNTLRGGLVPFASVVTDFGRHLAQVRGNDHLSGGEGGDTLVGDDQVIVAREVVFDEGAEALTRSLMDVSDDFSDLIHRQGCLDHHDHHHHDHHHDHHELTVDSVFTVGHDELEGDAGNDVLIGDDSVLVELGFSVAVSQVADFERFAEGVSAAGDELAHAVLDLQDVDFHLRDTVDLVALGNDDIRGGDGSDLVVGDDFVTRLATVTVVPGGLPPKHSDDDAWEDDDWKDRRHHDHHHQHHHHDHGDHWHVPGAKAGVDFISGGNGDDLVWGDGLALVQANVVKGASLGHRDFGRVDGDADDAIEAFAVLTDRVDYWLALPHHHHHSHHDDRGLRNGDDISGGDGNDIVFGQVGDDRLRGDAGDDWLIGGDGRDSLDGGQGKDRESSGNENSSSLRGAVKARLINWSGTFDSFGVPVSPFGELKLDKSGRPKPASFDFLGLDG